MKNIKLICWNVAGSRFPGTYNFFEKQAGEIDIFCLQEIIDEFASPLYPKTLHRTIPLHHKKGARVNFPSISKILGNYARNFSPHADFLEAFAPEGPMMALRNVSDIQNPINRIDFGSFDIFAGQDYATNVVLQWLLLVSDSLSLHDGLPTERRVIVTNTHGLWQKSGKGDSELKIQQSERIVRALRYLKERFNCEFVVTGDFNVTPDTKSISILEEFGLRNLIKDFGITSTRTSIYTKEPKFADYVFVSSGVKVNEFKVLPEESSDHAPLYLDFSIP
jgi:endonuclease/exonuclease/phosphatase family protein